MIKHHEACQQKCIPNGFNGSQKIGLNSSEIKFEQNQHFEDFKPSTNDSKNYLNLADYIIELQKEEMNSNIEKLQFINEKTLTIIQISNISFQKHCNIVHFQVFLYEIDGLILQKRKSLSVQDYKIQSKQIFKQISFSDKNEEDEKFCYFKNEQNDGHSQKQDQDLDNLTSQNQKISKINESNNLEQPQKLKNQDKQINKEISMPYFQEDLISESISSKEELQSQEKYKINRKQNDSSKSLKNIFQKPIDQIPQFQKQKTVKDQLYKRKSLLQKSFSFGSSEKNEVDKIYDKIVDQNQIQIAQDIENLDDLKIQETSEDSVSLADNDQYEYVIQKSKNESEQQDLVSLDQMKNPQQLNLLFNNIEQQEKSCLEKNQSISIKPTFSGISQSILYSQMQELGSYVDKSHIKRKNFKKSKSLIDDQNNLQQNNQKINKIQILFSNLPQGQLQKNLQNELEQIDESSKNRDMLSNMTIQHNQFKSVESLIRNNLDSIENLRLQKKKKLKKKKKKQQGEMILILNQLIDHYENKLEQKQTALQFFKKKVKDLEFSLDSNKIFLNMVVHDMRNPTNQVEFLVTETLTLLKQIKNQINEKLQQIKNRQQQQNQNLLRNSQQSEKSLSNQFNINNQERQIIIQIEEEKEQSYIVNFQNQINKKFKICKSYVNEQQYNSIQNKPSNSAPLQGLIQNDNEIQKQEQNIKIQNEIKINKNMIKRKAVLYEKFQQQVRKMGIQRQVNDKNGIEYSMKSYTNRSVDNKEIKEFKEIQAQKRLSPQQKKRMNCKVSELKKNEKIYRGQKRQSEVLKESKYTVQSIKNQIDLIEVQKNQFFNVLNYHNDKKISRKHQLYRIGSYNDQSVVSQALEIVNKMKYNLFNVKEREDLLIEQEPKIIKKKFKSLHISFDPKLLDSNQQANNIKKDLETNLNVYNIEIEGEANQIINNNQIIGEIQENIELDILFFEDLIQNLESSLSSLQNCKYCSVMLLNLINDMMDLAKTEQMKFELNCEFFDLTQTIQRAFDSLSYFGEQKNIKPQLIVDKNIEPFFKNLNGDEARFSQIFQNFISNAFKFTPLNGNITVELCKADDQIFFQKKNNKIQIIDSNEIQQIQNYQDQKQSNQRLSYQYHFKLEDENQINEIGHDNYQIEENYDSQQEYFISFQIRIKDSGMGISQTNINKLFLNFGKLADPTGCNKTGTGLGLSICKHLIEKMGGKVKVESEGEGNGTTFIIKMQAISKVCFAVENQLLSILSANQSQISEFKNLISNPSKDMKEIIKEQKEALNLKIESNQDNLIYIMDQLSPNAKLALQEDFLNSSQLISCKKIQEEKNSELIKISRSDNIQQYNQKSSLGLADTIKSLKVLIINDEFFILQMLIMMVKKANIQDIDTAQNGFDGFNMVLKKQYDFIICDLNMPVMDGFECVQKIKEYYSGGNSFFQKQPILEDLFCPYLVACSAYIDKKTEEKSILAGFELVVQSPLTFQTLKDKIIVMTLEKKSLSKQNNLKKSSIIFQENHSPLHKHELDQDIRQENKIKLLIDKLENKIRDENHFEKQQLLLNSLNEIDLESSKNSENEESLFQNNKMHFGIKQNNAENLSKISEDSEKSIQKSNDEKQMRQQKGKNNYVLNNQQKQQTPIQKKEDKQEQDDSFSLEQSSSNSNKNRKKMSKTNISSLMMNIGQNEPLFNRRSDSYKNESIDLSSKSQSMLNQQLISFQNIKVDNKNAQFSLKYSNNDLIFDQMDILNENSHKRQSSVSSHSPKFSQQQSKVGNGFQKAIIN